MVGAGGLGRGGTPVGRGGGPFLGRGGTPEGRGGGAPGLPGRGGAPTGRGADEEEGAGLGCRGGAPEGRGGGRTGLAPGALTGLGGGFKGGFEVG